MITRHSVDDDLPRHRHAEPYIAVVLTGGYVEAGDGGRWQARPGTVVFHDPNEAHRDTFDTAETRVLNLPSASGTISGAGLIDDIDRVARAAERDPRAAADLVAEMVRPGARRFDDWPDRLAQALNADPALSLAQWAEAHRLLPTSVSRGFSQLYGVSPKRFRLEARARRALRDLAGSFQPLADLAAKHGFADQAHLTRAVVALTGATPTTFRAKSVQAVAAREC